MFVTDGGVWESGRQVGIKGRFGDIAKNGMRCRRNFAILWAVVLRKGEIHGSYN